MTTLGRPVMPAGDKGKESSSMSRVRNTLLALIAIGAAASAATGGTFASFNAKATGQSTITAGSLLMTLGKDGASNGLPETITAMAPGDVYNVYVLLTNTGTLASAAGMTLAFAAAPANALTNGSVAGEGLSVAVTMCSVAWTVTVGTPGSGTCSGTSTVLLASTALSAFGASQNLATAALAASGGAAHLQFQLTLAGTETSTNGVAPASTIQALNTTITWTFTEVQRAAQTTNN
jgi:predicted ribosomally synthesized peptide with SipW-like signal peptide